MNPRQLVLTASLLLTACGSKPVERRVEHPVKSLYSVSDPQFEQAMGTLLGPSLMPGNHAVTLVNGDEIFPAMLAGIRSAKRSITFESYVWRKGKTAHEFALALAERARHGVKVHIVFDAQGADSNEDAMLRDAGVQLEIYRPFKPWKPLEYNHRTHRKLLVIDGRVGFIGGAGIDPRWEGHADSKEHWRDTHFRVTGPVVAQLQAVFADNWMKTRGELLHGADYFPPLSPAGGYTAQIFPSSPTHGSMNAYLMYLLAIASAQKSILIESAYFVPDRVTLAELAAAARRGVRVEIIVPGPFMDQKKVTAGSRPLWGDLLAAGVKLFQYQPSMLHCKATIVDDLFCSVGSSNFDNRSFRLNDEANMNVMNRDFAREQRRLFEDDRAKSREVTLEEWKQRPLTQRAAEVGTRALRPLL